MKEGPLYEMKNYGAEKGMKSSEATKNDHDIEVGRGTKGPSLHGKHTLENKKALPDNMANEVSLEENLALDIRKAEVLDYLEGGGDGKGDVIEERLMKFEKDNPELIVHQEVDELYPKG